MIKNEAVIFDLDGTLWDASLASAKGYTLALKKLGINQTITAKQIQGVSGKPHEECMQILFPGLKEHYPVLLDTLDKCERKTIMAEGGKLYDGVLEGMPTLVSQYHIFIVSNCQTWYLYVFFELSGLKKYLTGFDCNGISGQLKNEMLVNIKNKYSLNNPIYIGDTAGDEQAANLANIEFIQAAYGFGEPIDKVRRLNSFTEVLNHFRAKN